MIAIFPLPLALKRSSAVPAAIVTFDVKVHMELRKNAWLPAVGMLHAAGGVARHALDSATQKNPVDVEQVFEPQVQLLAFTEDPSVNSQRTSWPHWFDDARQNNPVEGVH